MLMSMNSLNRILRRVKLDPSGDFSSLSKEEDFILRAISHLIERKEIISEESIERFINSGGEKTDVRTVVGFLMGKGILRT
jgi:hypothetical protein